MSSPRVLVVCTGNICRSPFVERVLRARLGPAAQVESAGTRALVGEPADPQVQTLLVERGIDGTGHAARRLTPDLITDADLVLTATRDHRSAVLALRPVLLKRTFTIREFARIAPTVSEDGTVLDPAAVADSRALCPPSSPADDDLADPFGRGADAFRRMATEVDAVVDPLASAIARIASRCAGRTGRDRAW